jgi:threonine/homoserine/homoserine lactone efflux protein
MSSSTVILGALIGLSVAAPIGPINLLCIRRTLSHGPALGFVSGLGSATGHVIYSAIPGLGLSAVSNVLVDHRVWLQVAGSLLLAYLGLRTLTSKGAAVDRGVAEQGALGAFGSSCLLTLSNPMTIISFAAAFAGIDLAVSQREPVLFAVGVFIGSVAWRGGLCLMTSIVRGRLTSGGLTWVNRGASLALAGLGVIGLVGALGAR